MDCVKNTIPLWRWCEISIILVILHHIMLGLIEGKSLIILVNIHCTVILYCTSLLLTKVTSVLDVFLKLNSSFETYQWNAGFHSDKGRVNLFREDKTQTVELECHIFFLFFFKYGSDPCRSFKCRITNDTIRWKAFVL